jgi:hypothetical protein
MSAPTIVALGNGDENFFFVIVRLAAVLSHSPPVSGSEGKTGSSADGCSGVTGSFARADDPGGTEDTGEV